MDCFAIYNYLHEDHRESKEAGYYLIYVFDDKGFIDRELLEDNFVESFHRQIETKNLIGPFEGVSHIRDFIFKLSTHMQAKFYLLSVEQYNQSLEQSSEASELVDQMKAFGQEVEDLEVSSAQKIWSRLFKKR